MASGLVLGQELDPITALAETIPVSHFPFLEIDEASQI